MVTAPIFRNVMAQLTALCTNAHERHTVDEKRCISKNASTASSAWSMHSVVRVLVSISEISEVEEAAVSRASLQNRQTP